MCNPVSNILSKELHTSNIENKDIAAEITSAATAFQKNQGMMLAGTGGLQFLEQNNKRFFGVHKNGQEHLDFQEVRSQILHQLRLNPTTKIVQVIGDSARFSPLGTAVGMKFLREHLSENDLLLWGYTGKATDASGCCEVNQLVTNWLENDPKRLSKAIANVVDFHTPMAIREWKCSISTAVKNFYLVYPDVKFGGDTASSDGLSDSCLCLEGGVQSWEQVTNLLARDISVTGLYNMRGENNPETLYNGAYLTFFSVGEFIDLLQQEIERKGGMTQKEVEKFKDHYFNPVNGPKRYLFNPSRKDADTKQALWDKGWKTFIDQKLWHKLSLCNFKNVGRTIDQYISKNVKQKRVIITGGPSVGKTTTKNVFKSMGMAVVDEAATDVIAHELALGITEPWAKDGFREKIIALQKQRYQEALAKNVELVFFDRSQIDTFTYCLHLGCEPTPQLIKAVQDVVNEDYYHKTVFLLENLGFSDQNEIRCEDQEESLILEMRLEESYKKLGFTVIRVASAPVEERVTLIRDRLLEKTGNF